MNTITITYTIKYYIDFAPNYVFTKCNKLFNSKTSRQIKQTQVNGSIGYCINGKFYSLNKLRVHLKKIKKRDTPF